MLTKISRGIRLHRVHTVSATVTCNKSQSVPIPRDNINEIWEVLAKNFWPECVRYFFKLFFPQNPAKSRSTPKIAFSVCYDLGKSYSEYENHPWKFSLLDQNWCRRNKKKKKKEEKKSEKKTSDENIRHRVLWMGCLNDFHSMTSHFWVTGHFERSAPNCP